MWTIILPFSCPLSLGCKLLEGDGLCMCLARRGPSLTWGGGVSSQVAREGSGSIQITESRRCRYRSHLLIPSHGACTRTEMKALLSGGAEPPRPKLKSVTVLLACQALCAAKESFIRARRPSPGALGAQPYAVTPRLSLSLCHGAASGPLSLKTSPMISSLKQSRGERVTSDQYGGVQGSRTGPRPGPAL